MPKPTINPYYGKWDTPKKLNRFQRAVFNGRTTKVNDSIVAGENVYATTDLNESPLFISIVRDHTAIVSQILDVYEADLQFVRQFFQTNHNIAWTQRPVFVAHGEDNINRVNELSAGMAVVTDHRFDETRTMVVLLKSLHGKKILWLRPHSSEDNVKIAQIVECIWNDGVIDLQHEGHWGRTVFDAAALRNQPELYCRLHNLSPVEPEKSIKHLLQMCRHYDDQLEFFERMWNRTCQPVDIADMLTTNVDVLVLPAYYDQFDIFMLFMESVADRTEIGENRQAIVMANILTTYKVRDSTLMEAIIWADEQRFVQQCLVRLKPNLLSIGSCKETVLLSLIRQKPSAFMTQFVVDHFNQVLTTDGMEAQVIQRLIEGNWSEAVKILYGRYQSSRKVLFRDKKQGVQCLLNAIDGCRYDLANYLVDAHRSELSDPDDVTQLILYCSFVERSVTVLQTLLTLPAADCLRTSGPVHYFKSPLYVALKYRHLVNFQLLLDNVHNRQGLRDLREDNGENLLFVAIWYRENPVDETPFVYVEEEQASLEIVDSSDDEAESVRKTARNEQILTSTGPYTDPIMPRSFFEQQSKEMARIFNYLLNDLCLDPRCVNNVTGETLLHIAVKHNNLEAVNQLLGLGVDPNVKDSTGNYAMHGVRSLAILNRLREHECDINVTNSAGETPLLSYVKTIIDGVDDDQESREVFLIELLKAGATITHSDINGLTVLHLVKKIRIAQILLLQPGAPINARNSEGETPILYLFRDQPDAKKLFKQFLCHDDLDLMAVSHKNVSLLSVLVSLDDATMAEVLASLTKHSKSTQLEDLFVQHCNSVDFYGYPVLIAACSEHTNSYCLNRLLNVDELNPNAHSDYQPLETECKDTVQRLIERGANINGIGDDKRKTPLMHAIGGRSLGGYTNNFDTFAVLLAAGADVNVIDPNGNSALDYAAILENLKDARRTIAALILANVNYIQPSCEKELPFTKVLPFQCLYLG